MKTISQVISILLIAILMYPHPVFSNQLLAPAGLTDTNFDISLPMVKIFIADTLASDESYDAIQTLIRRYYKGEVMLLDYTTYGVGKKVDQLKEVLKRDSPHIVVVRSDTKAFGNHESDPNFVSWAYENGVRAIIRIGAGVETIDKVATTDAGISLVRTGGNSVSVANLALRFLLAALAQELAPGKFTKINVEYDFAVYEPWKNIFNVPLKENIDALLKSKAKGRGEMTEAQKQVVLSPYSKDQILEILNRLNGKTIGLIGFGATAQDFASRLNEIRIKLRKLSGIDFTIMATSPGLNAGNPERVKEADKYDVLYRGEGALLAKSDIISFHLPEDEGKDYFDQQKLVRAAKLRTIINTARLGVITSDVWPAFYKREGSLCFADLNAADNGVPIDLMTHLLATFKDQFYNTPHIAASTKSASEGTKKNMIPTLEAMLDYFFGITPEYPVDIVNGIIPKPIQQSPKPAQEAQKLTVAPEDKDGSVFSSQ